MKKHITTLPSLMTSWFWPIPEGWVNQPMNDTPKLAYSSEYFTLDRRVVQDGNPYSLAFLNSKKKL